MRYGLCFILAGLFVSAAAAQPAQEPRPAEDAPSGGSPATDVPVLGAPSAFDLSTARGETLWVEADARLHREPALRSPTLTRLAADAELPLLERRGAWARVRYGSWQGWVLLDGEDPEALLAEIASDESPVAPALAPRSGPDEGRLVTARGFLKNEREVALGPYRLYTDVTRDDLLAELSELAAQLPDVFRQRYDLAAEPGEGETVVLYAEERSYRDYAGAQGDPSAADSLGHAVGGLAVLSAGHRQESEVRSLLIHELTHLLTYRALGPDLPPWLVEGLADDLAFSRVAASGEILPGTLGGWRAATTEPIRTRSGQVRFAITTVRGGPQVSLEVLRQKWHDPDRPSLDVLLDLAQPDFMASERRWMHYSMSAFLVRYLMASEERAAGFRAYLRAVARGARGDNADFLALAATSWQDLETGFANWIMSGAPARNPGRKKAKKKVKDQGGGPSTR